MNTLAIIPARSGSKSIKDKNILEINNNSLIDITIKSAIKSEMIYKIILSSDNEMYLNIGKNYDILLDKRPDNLSEDGSDIIDLIKYLLDKYFIDIPYPDNIILLQPTSPLREIQNIIDCIKLLNNKDDNNNGDEIDSVISVTKMDHIHIPEKCMIIDNNYLKSYLGKNNLSPKQLVSNYYFRNGAIYATKVKSFFKYNSFLGNNNIPYIMDKQKSFDIDDVTDYNICKLFLQKKYTYKLAIYIGTRANYSSLKKLIKLLLKSDNIDLQIICGGPGINTKFGNLPEILKKDGIVNIEYCDFLMLSSNLSGMAKSTSLGIYEAANILERIHTDMILLVGDRYDVYSFAIAASLMNIRICHTMGGEISGTIDEIIRHCITKLSHIHFPANEDAKQRIIKLGEDPKNIMNYGCPRMDLIKDILEKNLEADFFSDFTNRNTCKTNRQFVLKKNDYIIVIFHPVTTDYINNRIYCKNILEALNKIGRDVVLIWPNSDAGCDFISKEIRTFMDKTSETTINMCCFINLSLDEFIPLLNNCLCLVGNSSTGIRDCGFMGVPVVNIGERQINRLCSKNVLHSNNDSESINSAIQKQLIHGKYEQDFLYGYGNTCEKIFTYLDNLNINTINLEKKIFY